MRFYDTALRQLTTFIPHDQTVHMYVCGVTPYDAAHLGHIFTFLTYDLLQRRLEDLGYTVKLVRNVTDVDEPIFKRAHENKEHYIELAKRETAAFQIIMQELNFRNPTAEPLASDYVQEMATAVKQLLDTKHAYHLAQDIYFDTKTFDSFGSFSGFSTKLQTAFMQDRGGDPKRPGKRNPLDFLLWRGITDEADPAAWDTVLGRGRPGWHIECSVMSGSTLGLPIDIHGGGTDLIFPHHECEIAQSESLDNTPFVRNWLHVAPLSLHGEKMSKSLGNLVFAKDLLKDGDPAAVRLALMNYHYRTGGEWREELWDEAKQLVQQLRNVCEHAKPNTPSALLTSIRDALDDNLDTPTALEVIKAHVYAKENPDDLPAALTLLGIAL